MLTSQYFLAFASKRLVKASIIGSAPFHKEPSLATTFPVLRYAIGMPAQRLKAGFHDSFD